MSEPAGSEDQVQAGTKQLSAKKLKRFQDKVERSGIIYLSKVPPFLKPHKLRHMLQKFGDVGRIYLTPEDTAVRAARKRKGGNKRQSFVDGWVEFEDKSIARRVAASLNATPIGGKNTEFHAFDLWNLKYLPKFKWHHLTEKLAHDNMVRRQRLLNEVSQAKKEKQFYLDKVEMSKKIDAIERKRAKKQNKQVATTDATTADEAAARPEDKREKRKFKQRETIAKGTPITQTSLLSKIFGESETAAPKAKRRRE